jgi:hypothetical protein
MSSRLHSIRSCISHRIITLTFIRFEVGACTVERGSRTEQFTQSGVATGVGYAEARYNRICMNNNLHTDYVPVTFGFRW